VQPNHQEINMLTKQLRSLILVFIVLLLWMSLSYAAAPQLTPENEKQPAISLPEDVGTAIAEKAASVKTEIANQASSLFKRKPIGWNWNTIEYLIPNSNLISNTIGFNQKPEQKS
jgi:hypothetical protein